MGRLITTLSKHEEVGDHKGVCVLAALDPAFCRHTMLLTRAPRIVVEDGGTGSENCAGKLNSGSDEK